MAQIDFKDRAAADAAVAEVRNDASGVNWALFGYAEGSKNVLVLENTGKGGHGELVPLLKPERIQYALLRVNDTVDNHVTVKFVQIFWIGDRVKAAQRALTATHKGEVTAFLGAAHVSLYGSSLAEVAESVIMRSITDASGTSNRVLTADLKPVAATPSAGSGAARREVGGAGSGELTFQDQPGIERAIATLRKDSEPQNWLLISYQGNTNTVALAGTGSGGVRELSALLRSDSIAYGLLRVAEKVDDSTVTKFVEVQWVGDEIAAVRKAKVTTHRGQIESLLGQRHVSVYASKADELTDELIQQKVKDAAGISLHVRGDAVPAPVVQSPSQPHPAAHKAPPASVQKTVAGGMFRGAGTATSNTRAAAHTAASHAVPKGGGGNVSFANEPQLREALAAVRKDGHANDWLVIGYQGSSSVIELKGTGGGGLEALKSKLSADAVAYGLLRTQEKIDDSVVTKFVFVLCIGEAVKGVRKAATATHKGAVTEFVGQFHVDVTVASPSELTQELVRSVVQKAAGTFNK